ncbi:MAG: hypothetical protein LAT52_03820, partial [Balneolales bacterium]|nr:hypothetical protein [Balneolales bacterium]
MKLNRPFVFILPLLGLIILFVYSCDTTSASKFEPVTFSGLVTDVNDNPLPNTIVRITNPRPERITITDQQGIYGFTVDVDSTITFTVEAQKEGFQPASQQFLAIPERDVTLPVFKLSRVGGDEGDEGDDGDGGTVEPTPPDDDSNTGSAFITLQSLQTNTIQVRETGGVEQTKFEFIVTDSLGNPVSNNRSVFVHFEILSGPDGGEGVFPDSIRTENGIARGTLSSGTVSGVVQVRASFMRDGVMARSNPVSITIAGGLPDDNHFEVYADPMNVPAANRASVPVSVLLGDRYGNTVPAGTAVFFSTDRGN